MAAQAAVTQVHQHSFTMTAERADQAQAALERALWAQAERFYAATRPVRVVLRWIAVGICVYGAAQILLLAPPWEQPHFAWALLAFVALIPVFVLFPVAEARLRQRARRRCARSAERALRPVRAKVPYDIHYTLELSAHRLITRAPSIGVEYELPLQRAGFVLVSEGAVCLFRSRRSLAPFRILYAPSDAERAVLIDQLRAAGANVSGGSPG